jgi:hypothetical protein
MVGSLGLAATQSALSDEVQPGFYFGVGAGEASFDDVGSKGELDGIVRSALITSGFQIVPNTFSSTYEDSDTSLALFAGYHFNQYLSVEGGYIDLGAAEYRSTGSVRRFGMAPNLPLNTSIDVETTGFTLAGIGSWPLGSVFELHGRLGFFFSQTDLSVSLVTPGISGATGSSSDSLDSVGAYYGVGAGFNFAQHWSLSLDWTRYDNVGDEDEDDDVEAGFDVDALSLSATFRF